ncbi:MAG: AsnC family transcriptional regulator [Acidimicrobiales bacterium]
MLDETDKKIVRLLQKNARTPNTEIARKLGVAETTVRNRVTRMLDEDQIKMIAVVNPDATEATISAFLLVAVRPADLDTASEHLHDRPEVRYLGLTLGGSQLMVEAFFRDHGHLLEFQNEVLGGLDGIGAIETLLVVRVAKFSYEWEI